MKSKKKITNSSLHFSRVYFQEIVFQVGSCHEAVSAIGQSKVISSVTNENRHIVQLARNYNLA